MFKVGRLKAEGAGHEVVPQNDEHHDEGYCQTWVQALAVGVCLLEILGKLAAIGRDIGRICWRFAICYLLFALGFGHEAVEFILALGSVDVYAAKTAGTAGGEEGHGGIGNWKLEIEILEFKSLRV